MQNRNYQLDNMATFMIRLAFLLASLVFLFDIGADASVDEFKALKDELFGKGDEKLSDDIIEGKLHSMIRLIEAEGIPAEVQGEQSLEYLKSLTDDCKNDRCSLDEDLRRLDRLSKRGIEAANLNSYLSFCQDRIKERCANEILTRVSAKLSSVSEESMKAVDALALESYNDQQRLSGDIRSNADSPNHVTVLRALKRLDPPGSQQVLKKWTGKEAALAKLMDKIRLPCVEFLQNVDPIVKLFEANYWDWKVSSWHNYLNKCQKVVDNWDKISKDAIKSYHIHLE